MTRYEEVRGLLMAFVHKCDQSQVDRLARIITECCEKEDRSPLSGADAKAEVAPPRTLYLVTNDRHGLYLVRCATPDRAIAVAKAKARDSGDMFWIDGASKVAPFPVDGDEVAYSVA